MQGPGEQVFENYRFDVNVSRSRPQEFGSRCGVSTSFGGVKVDDAVQLRSSALSRDKGLAGSRDYVNCLARASRRSAHVLL